MFYVTQKDQGTDLECADHATVHGNIITTPFTVRRLKLLRKEPASKILIKRTTTSTDTTEPTRTIQSIGKQYVTGLRRHYANNLEEMRAKKRVQGNRYRMSHGDKVRRNAREWRIKNPDLLFDYRLHEKYGISSREYRQMLLDQKGKCKICGRSGIKLVVDHDHVTNRVRGLICIRCNIALAIYENTEWMTKALAYLADPPMNKIIAMREENKLQ